METKKVKKKEQEKVAKAEKRLEKELRKKEVNYINTRWYHVLQDTIILVSLVISIIGIYIAILVRKDTFELTKMSDKDIYYTIRLYPTKEVLNCEDYGKYIRIALNLIVDDFSIQNKNLGQVNYNAKFSHIKYFMVYDYQKEQKKYFYKVDKLDDKTQAQMRLEEKYHVEVSEMNYSLTPNREYAYILIQTQTNSRNNLDLIFFKYKETEDSIDLELEENENGNVEVVHHRINKDVTICKEYYIQIWAEEEKKQEDIAFMFDVYEDLLEKSKD